MTPDTPAKSPPVVLFYTDNGLGLGHLTRQAAVARRAGGDFVPAFVTMSAGYALLRDLGIGAEYFPSYGRLGITKREWEPMIADRLFEAVRMWGASVVVVDHVSPPRIFASLRERLPGVRFVWSRRGLWQAGKNAGALELTDTFDAVIEPGDLASPIDRGATVAYRSRSIQTDPIVLIDPREFLSRAEARRSLGLPEEGRAILINVGDSDPAEVGRMISEVSSVVTQSAGDEPIHLFAPLHPLHGERATKGSIRMVPVYPVAKQFAAFDGAVSTAGYNSFHEIVGSGLPVVFVPHRGASVDDQRLRAEFAAMCGRAQWAPDVYGDDFLRAIVRMLRRSESTVAAATTEKLGPMMGADQFARLLVELAADARPDPPELTAHTSRTDASAYAELMQQSRRLIPALDQNDSRLAEEAALIGEEDLKRTIAVVSDGNPKAMYERGMLFESILTATECAPLGIDDYEGYVSGRLAGIQARFNASL